MKNQRSILIVLLTALLSLAIAACASGPTETPVESGQSSSSEEAGDLSSSEQEGSSEDTAAGEQPAGALPEVIHVTFPANRPRYAHAQTIFDCNTGDRGTLEQPVNVGSGCDRWGDNYLERPHDQAMAVFIPRLDIVTAQMGEDEEWLYARIDTYPASNGDPDRSDIVYALELDINMDSRGDALLLVVNPTQPEDGAWSVAGVQVWQDANDDIGDDTAMLSDGKNGGDGYEALLFDQGLGGDPDLAWARISPEGQNVIEFAFKRDVVKGEARFMWWAWALMGELEPGSFDYVDEYGSNSHYMLDNTCAWIFGGLPREGIPGLCQFFQPTNTPDVCVRPPEATCSEANEYWDGKACRCRTCPFGQVWNPNIGRCQILN